MRYIKVFTEKRKRKDRLYINVKDQEREKKGDSIEYVASRFNHQPPHVFGGVI